MPVTTAPPAHVAPVQQGVTLDEIQVESQGRVYHIRLGMACGVNGIPSIRKIVRIPSNKETLYVDCDGSTGVDVLQDPTPAVQTGTLAPKKK